jgi:short-subunit dehydrogenase
MPLPPPGPDAHVLVTGASSGIGAAISRALAVRGYPTMLVARREEALTELAAELRDRSGLTSEVHAADLGSEEGRDIVRRIVLDDERVVGVVNAAGSGSPAAWSTSPTRTGGRPSTGWCASTCSRCTT